MDLAALRARASAMRVSLPVLSATNFRQLGLAKLHGGFSPLRETAVSFGCDGGLRFGTSSNVCTVLLFSADTWTSGSKGAGRDGGGTDAGIDRF